MERRRDEGGAEHGSADGAAFEIERQRFRQRDDCIFCHRVGAVAQVRVDLQSADRRGIDHMPGLAMLSHPRHQCPDAVDDALHIDAEDPFPLRRRHLP
jgi:hypothetical protein